MLERDEKLGLACVLPIALVMLVSPVVAIWQNPRLGHWTEGFWLYTLLFMVVPATITVLLRDSIFLWPCLIYWLGWVLGACIFTCMNGRYGDHPEPGLMQFADLWSKGMLGLVGLSFILCVVLRWRRG